LEEVMEANPELGMRSEARRGLHLALHNLLVDYEKSGALLPLARQSETWIRMKVENLNKVLEFNYCRLENQLHQNPEGGQPQADSQSPEGAAAPENGPVDIEENFRLYDEAEQLACELMAITSSAAQR